MQKTTQNASTKESALLSETTYDSAIYKEAMLRPNTVHWKHAYTEELEQFAKQKLFSIVLRPIG